MDHAIYSFVADTLRRAGDELLLYYRKPDLSMEVKGVDDLVTEADHASEALLIGAIRERFPGHSILSEESGLHATTSPYVWLLDPLEATYNFSRGLPLWGINMALSVRGEVRIGAFFDPLLNELYYAEQSQGVFRNGSPIQTSGQDDARHAAVYCSTRNHVDRLSGHVRKFRHIGSIGNALAYVAAGHLDAAVETGGGPWDYAAGALLVHEAGGLVSRIDISETAQFSCVLAAASPALYATLETLLAR